ncbi:unnamed protein product [Adineta steineri]|uniref:Uncharacterized protein n=2 Tax=Adineta steineri TaxID=433720 RepID=A0A814WZ26_9BILA|nr:unnamed protein product [Adineta steineri]
MNSNNVDYSFTNPTWNLPSVDNSTMQPGTYDNSYAVNEPNLDPDMSTWNNTQYMPPNANRGAYPPTTNQESGEYFNQPGPPTQAYQQPEEYMMQPNFPQSYQQPDQQFMQPAPPPAPHYYQQPAPPLPAPQYYQQPAPPPPPPAPQHYQQPGPPPPPPQSHQQPGERFVQPGPPQSYQLPNISYQNNGNYNNGFDFNANANANDQYSMPKQSRPNGYSNEQNVNRGPNLPRIPQPVQKRSPNNDHNRPGFFTDYGSNRENHNSHSPNQSPISNRIDQKSKSRGSPTKDYSFDLMHSSVNRPNNFKIHEYLYGLSAPDPGSYVNAYKNQRRRLDDEKANHKSVITEYKSFVQNGGFGPAAFGKTPQQTYEEKLDTEKKRKSYSKQVQEINHKKIEEQKRIRNNGGSPQARAYAPPTLRRPRPQVLTSQFLFTPEVKEFERKLKREHDANCKCSLHAKPFQSLA